MNDPNIKTEKKPHKKFPKTCECGVIEKEDELFRRQLCRKCDNYKRQNGYPSAIKKKELVEQQKQEKFQYLIENGIDTSNVKRPGAIKLPSERKIRSDPELRSKPELRPFFILMDSNHWDKRHGFENDLSEEYIKEEISEGCTYCLAQDKKMTIDRINNDKGHTMDNIVGCCIDCNYLRKDMPFAAWTVVSKYVREARQNGLLENWSGSKK